MKQPNWKQLIDNFATAVQGIRSDSGFNTNTKPYFKARKNLEQAITRIGGRVNHGNVHCDYCQAKTVPYRDDYPDARRFFIQHARGCLTGGHLQYFTGPKFTDFTKRKAK